MNSSQQKYPPGSNWLYIRIYGGPQALEEWISGPLRLLLAEWYDAGLVRMFHFIRFLDPDYHLRIRFLMGDPKDSGILLHKIHVSCQGMLDEDLFWKIEVGTYEPEYERYGISRMQLAEAWFEVDSLYWLDEIGRRAEKDDPEVWKSAAQSIQALLEDFGAGIDEKINIMNRLRESAAAMAGCTRTMKNQLDEKYRKMAAEIQTALNAGTSDPGGYLSRRSSDSKLLVRQLQESFGNRKDFLESTLLPDLIHMSLNRAFRTRHRMQELVLYDFMARYYESERARSQDAK